MSEEDIFGTERLLLRKLAFTDSAFILELLNTPGWLEFIGDRNVHNLDDAEKYLLNGPIASYRENGFGLWRVSIKESNTPIGICGLLKRDYLEDVDIGFALLPKYEGCGYGYEMAKETISYSKNVLDLGKVVAITDEDNRASVRLLNKIGLQFERSIETPQSEKLDLFS